MHAEPRDTERIGLALIISLGLHLVLMILMLAFGAGKIDPVRPESIPVRINFVPALPEPEPEVQPPRVEPVPAPAPRPSAQQAPPTPRRSAAEAAAAPQPQPSQEFEEFVPGPAESVAGSFSHPGSSTARGGRVASSDEASIQSTAGMSALDRGSEEGEASVTISSADESRGSTLSDEDLAALEEALAGARAGSGGNSGSAGDSPVAAPVAAEGFADLQELLSYRGATYTGLGELTADAKAEIEATGATVAEVDISFRISPLGTIHDLQTTAESRYPALDAFLRAQLPGVLSFEPLPQDGPYAELWQEVDLRLSVKSN